MAKTGGSGAFPDAVTDALKELAGSVTHDRAKEMVLAVLTGAAGTAAGALGGSLVWGGMAVLYAALTYRKAAGEKRKEEGTGNALAGILDSLAAHGSQLDGLAGTMAQGFADIDELRTRFDEVCVRLCGDASLMEFVLGEVVAQGDRIVDCVADLHRYTGGLSAQLTAVQKEVRQEGEKTREEARERHAPLLTSLPPLRRDPGFTNTVPAGALEALESFVQSDGAFAWGIVVGGASEHRLQCMAWLQAELGDGGWRIGCAKEDQPMEAWLQWKPSEKTLLVFDDAPRWVSRKEAERGLLPRLDHLAETVTSAGPCVRVLLLADAPQGDWYEDLLDTGKGRGNRLGTLWRTWPDVPDGDGSRTELVVGSLASPAPSDVYGDLLNVIREIISASGFPLPGLVKSLSGVASPGLPEQLIASLPGRPLEDLLPEIHRWTATMTRGPHVDSVRRFVCAAVALAVSDHQWLAYTRQHGEGGGLVLDASEPFPAELIVAALFNVATRWIDGDVNRPQDCMNSHYPTLLADPGESKASRHSEIEFCLSEMTCMRVAPGVKPTRKQLASRLRGLWKIGKPVFVVLPKNDPLLAELPSALPYLLAFRATSADERLLGDWNAVVPILGEIFARLNELEAR